MKYDIILCGVGGQGVLSVSAAIALAAMKEGLVVKQSEVHGMSQRGGAVQANLRIADTPIASDLIAHGTADMILSVEPLESMRYLPYLDASGILITSSGPVKNIPNYPDLDQLVKTIRSLPSSLVIDAEGLAREAGSGRAVNMVMVGAASHHLPLKEETLTSRIGEMFARKGEKIVEINIKAFNLGRDAGHGD